MPGGQYLPSRTYGNYVPPVAVSPLRRTIHVGKNPSAIAVDSRHNRVFVVNAGAINGQEQLSGHASVTVIDATTGVILRTVALGGSSYFVFPATSLNERTGRLFVATSRIRVNDINQARDPGVVSVLDTVTGNVLSRIPINRAPSQLVVDERTNRVFTNEGDMLDGTTGAVRRRGLVGGALLAVDGRTNRVFVADALTGDCGDGFTAFQKVCLSVLDAATGATLSTITFAQRVVGVAVDDRAGHVVVSMDYDRVNNDAPRLILLDATTAKVVHRVDGEGGTPLAVDTITGRAFTVPGSVIDTRSGRVISSRGVGAPNEQDITVVAVDERVGRVFFASASATVLANVFVALDGRTGQLRRRLSLGKGPPALAVDTQTGRVFVANAGDNTVSVLDARKL